VPRQHSTSKPTRFTGFADPEARFFRALAKHQDRAWFQAHRHEYDDGWVTPMGLLLAEVRERIDPLFVRHALGEPKIFRLHRDVRFAKDKSPYKTHIGGYVPLGGTGSGPAHPVPVYVQFGTETFLGAGHYMMDAGQLARYREAVLDERRGRALVRIVTALEKAGCTLVAFETLKKVPRGIDPAHPRAELLKRKSLAVEFPTIPKRLIRSPVLVGWLVQQIGKAVPLVEWLADVTD
jgi:uncharacterized protein (TIGR02453 family)